jgi:LPPG:FO 2-phospho-L-lactate transferase
MLDVVGADQLVVVANTADDVEVHGVHVSPDPDLVTYWLADLIDERGWGIAGDTWQVMSALEAAGRPAWFRLGDRDLAMCLIRTELLRAGERLTDAHGAVARAAGVSARVLPMSDMRVRTRVEAGGRWRDFQEFMIVDRAALPIEAMEIDGAGDARPSPEVLEALARAEVVVVGPSNPVISIGPILALAGVREALRQTSAPVVAVSPFVGGRAVKGPTEPFMAHAGLPLGVAGVLAAYEGLLDGVVCDEEHAGARLPTLVTDTLMDSREARRHVAEATLDFARGLAAAR